MCSIAVIIGVVVAATFHLSHLYSNDGRGAVNAWTTIRNPSSSNVKVVLKLPHTNTAQQAIVSDKKGGGTNAQGHKVVLSLYRQHTSVFSRSCLQIGQAAEQLSHL